MKDIKILDCTLRDGGYYTNWDFDGKLVYEYFKAMSGLPVDYIEIGYRSPDLKNYYGKYFFCPLEVMQEAKQLVGMKKLAIILNEKDIKLDQIEELISPCMGLIDMIRIAVDPKNIERALLLANSIKSMGFEVAFNVMYMSTWAENFEFLEKLKGVEEVVDVLYMVDSFGGVYPDDIKKLSYELQKRTTINLGFHGHNNLELALINTLTAIECGCRFVDATVTGMGRGAGNLKTELLLSHLQAKNSIDIDFFKLSAVTQSFEELQSEYKWGTSLPYMFSGANSLEQKKVMSWLGKNRYSFGEIIHAIGNDSNENIGNMKSVQDLDIRERVTFIVGGGGSVRQHSDSITKLIGSYGVEAIVIHAGTKHFSLFKDLRCKQICCLTGKEGHRLINNTIDVLNNVICIKGNNNQALGTYIPDELKDITYVLNQIKVTDNYFDSPLAIALEFLTHFHMDKIYLIGFDGYAGNNTSRVEVELANENQYIFNSLPMQLLNKIISLTPTKYKGLNIGSIYYHLCQVEK